ncbi:hypothetical protein PTTG_01515 [Puccinia triticina 1-1 BBBD Race 1]|uniref:Dimethylmenaquinone methyltransferase n=2 Tax=Puccinia triticina TaxID=208348 RepID=A0A0C4EL81_PUCT1|nr:uncharacterized protein PtA15_10A24 [Puccinia triticina]OAV88595.1 hypothetical protein PTTG_01515 [Puccinia triticina 1-1 BBBD Race 1]WAQ88605.1 hypothetical protein PtA15_10A24 [Puccinia triticina]WAR58687.1 hypothetical protein PtB15_10B25 [Puccinia triticina]
MNPDTAHRRVSSDIIRQIGRFSSCDIADALIRLKHPSGGYLPDINLQTANHTDSIPSKLCGEAFTVEMVPVTDTDSPHLTQQYVDAGVTDTVMVISSPANSKSAVWGGLMTARAKIKGIKGVVIDGRCRDLAEHRAADYLIFARGHSILGQSTFTRPSRIQVPIAIYPVCDNFGSPHAGKQVSFPPTTVNPHDVILGDEDGVVVIPYADIEEVINLCVKSTQVDQQCLEALKAGQTTAETFSRFRGK